MIKTAVAKTGLRVVTLIGFMTFVLFLTACVPSGIKKDLQAFSDGAATTITNTNDAFVMVDNNYYQVKVAQLVANYDEKGFNPGTVMRFLPSEELSIRLQTLQALKTYAEKLNEIMGDDKLKELDSETKSLGEGLLKLKGNDALKNVVPNDTSINILTSATDAIGHWFIDYKREKGVKDIVQDMNKPVQDICSLLVMDIGALPDSTGKGGYGLRAQLHNQYEDLLKAQDSFILHNKGLDPRSRREEIARLPEIVRERDAADATLSATQKAIKKLAETHTELARAFDAPTPKLKTLVRQLGAEGNRIGQFYKAIGK